MSRMSENVVAFAALVLAAPNVPLAYGQTAGDEPGKATVAELKSAYLACDREALGGRDDTGLIMQCSVVYEELLQRGFGGDFYKLLTWSRAHTPKRVAAGAAGPQRPDPDRGP